MDTNRGEEINGEFYPMIALNIMDINRVDRIGDFQCLVGYLPVHLMVLIPNNFSSELSNKSWPLSNIIIRHMN
ncbi:unnamed protein product [Schistosoma turkestanicum]|nr:unnamed protein product [Schistosoma turkestanicum]